MAEPQDWFSANAPTTAPPAGDWFAANSQTPNFKQTDTTPNEVDPNTLGTFVRHLWAGVNPVQIGQLLPFPKALGGSGVDNPLNPAKIVKDLSAVKKQADEALSKGEYTKALTHYVESVVPMLGPMMARQGDELQAGKYAAAAGDMTAMVANAAAPKVIGKAASVVAASDFGQAVADMAQKKSVQNVVDVIAPKVGANKVRFGRMASDVAPAVARDTTGLTRSSVADSIAGKLEDATAGLDEAADSRLNARTFPTAPVLKGLRAKRAALTSEAVQGSEFTPQSGVNRPALGADVVPAPNRARVAQIDQAINEVQQLGPVATYEALRRSREAYDGPAKAVYSPAVTSDFLTAQGGKLGAADVTSVIREHLAAMDPATAEANASYSLWKKASDVVSAAEEVERVRPTVGRTLMARGLGAAAGGATGGGLGAAVGAMVAPVIERVVSSASPAIKMIVARRLADLTDAIRAGDAGKAKAILYTVEKMAPATTVAAPSLRAVQPATFALPAAAQDQP